MSQGWKNGYWERFKCPLCGSYKYVEVRVQRPGGNWYTTPFYQCFHCTAMFTDPILFTKRDSTETAPEVIRGPGRIVPKSPKRE